MIGQVPEHLVSDRRSGIVLDFCLHCPDPAQEELELVLCNVGSAKLQRAQKLLLDLSVVVDEDGWQVLLREVGDAGLCDRLEELHGGELHGELAEVLVEEGAEWYTFGVQMQNDPNVVTGLVHLE